jgi:hypothetical protein
MYIVISLLINPKLPPQMQYVLHKYIPDKTLKMHPTGQH